MFDCGIDVELTRVVKESNVKVKETVSESGAAVFDSAGRLMTLFTLPFSFTSLAKTLTDY